MNIAVVGGLGKLGSSICQNLKDKGYFVDAFDYKNNTCICDYSKYDCAIDASTHTNSVLTAKNCAKQQVPLLVCATGHTKSELKQIEKYSSQTTIKLCPNLTVGINTICNWIEQCFFDNAEICIFERHHKHKKDSPSGTALMLESKIAKYAKKIEMLSSRLGEDLGTHNILIDLPYEQIEICHKVKSRLAFAEGAQKMVEKIVLEHKQKYEN